MTQTAIDVINRALVRVGASKITSLTDGSTEASVAAEEYEALVRARLTGHRWRFATAQVTLNRLVATPEARWQYAFQAPPDALLVNAVTNGGRLVKYDRFGDKVFTDTDAELVCDYCFRPDEVRWPPYFADAITHELAHAFSLSIARDEVLARNIGSRLERLWGQARLADSQQQSTRRISPSRFISVRH